MVNSDMVHEVELDGAPLETFSLFGFVFFWNEADIIASTVRNAFEQGCEKVFLIDHSSDDGSAQIAIDAGGTLYDTVRTRYHDENDKTVRANKCMFDISRTAGVKNAWWLFFDADEHPHGPAGATIREYLQTLPAEYRVVGSTFMEHYPGKMRLSPGDDPLKVFPKAEFSQERYCDYDHFKHQLIRFDKDAPQIFVGPGYHVFVSTLCPMAEPTQGIITHHFPYRNIDVTAKRLKAIMTSRRLQRTLREWSADKDNMQSRPNYNETLRASGDHQWIERYNRLREIYKKHEILQNWHELLEKRV